MRRQLALICAIVAASAAADAARLPQAALTSEIAGTVVTTSAPPAPIARVLVTISGSSLKSSRTVITDDRGRFAITNLPAGTYTVVAARPPYVRTAFGARRPGRPGTPISLAPGQRLTDVTIPLARGAAITGAVRNPDGEVAAGVRVEVTPLDAQAGALNPAVTDDRGIYRVFGLTPGRYLVSAAVGDSFSPQLTQFSDAEVDAILARLARRSPPGPGSSTTGRTEVGQRQAGPGPPSITYSFAPIFFPGTADPDQAEPVLLAEAEERSGVDIGLSLARTAAVEGRVSIASGPLPPDVQVTMTRLSARGRGASNTISSANTRPPDSSGQVRFTNVTPGRYRVLARVIARVPTGQTPPGTSGGAFTISDVLWAFTDITVAGDNISGLTLALQPGLRVSGRIAFDSQSGTAPKDVKGVQIRLVETTGATTFVPPASVRADGSFEVYGLLPGSYTPTATQSDSEWWLRSVVISGRDILDFPLELGASGDVSGAIATFTDRRTELSGTLQTAASIPAPDYFVVVLTRDRQFWRPGARRMQFTRPSTDGRFAFRDLPAGEYALAALTDMEPGDLLETSFLERLVQSAVVVRLGDGEKKVQDLKLVGR